MVFTLYWNDMGGEMCKCENVRMLRLSVNVQMYECANGRLLLLVAFAANVLCY